jgi:hypothetical protein
VKERKISLPESSKLSSSGVHTTMVNSVVNALDQIQGIVRLNSKLEDEVARLTHKLRDSESP